MQEYLSVITFRLVLVQHSHVVGTEGCFPLV